MPDITINDRTVTIERFTGSKASRIFTLLKVIHQKMPDITKQMAEFRARYRNDYAIELDRINAIAQIPSLEHLPEEEWERAGHKIRIPQEPSTAEMFLEIAPSVIESVEDVAYRLLGLIAMKNDVVSRYAKTGEIWDRVDEFVDETIRPAPFDEIMELGIVAAEMFDSQVLSKAQEIGGRAGNVARLFGMKSTRQNQQDSTTSNGQPESSSSPTSGRSQSDTDGSPTPSEISIGTTVSDSSTQTQSSATVS